jgi:O-antigen/teichoic acid export membrane protein
LPRLRRTAVRDLLGYGMPASLASVSWVAFRNCDYAIIGGRLGTLQAGFYFRAYQLAVEYQKKIGLILSQVAFPVLSRSASAAELNQLRGQMVRLLSVIMFPPLALFAAVAPTLVPWLLGPRWAPVVGPAQILAVGGAAVMVIDTVGVALMATGRSRAMLGYGVAHFAVYAAAVVIVAPNGITAVAIAAAVVHTLFVIVAYLLLLRGEHPLRNLWADVAPATVSCLGLAAAAVPTGVLMSAAHSPTVLRVIAVGAAAAAGYGAVLRGAFAETWSELRRVAGRMLPVGRLRRRRAQTSALPSLR